MGMLDRLPTELREMLYDLVYLGKTKRLLPPLAPTHTEGPERHRQHRTTLQEEDSRMSAGLKSTCKGLRAEYLARARCDITIGINPITCDACWMRASQYLSRQPKAFLGAARHSLCDVRNFVGPSSEALSIKRQNKMVKRAFILWGACSRVRFPNCLS